MPHCIHGLRHKAVPNLHQQAKRVHHLPANGNRRGLHVELIWRTERKGRRLLSIALGRFRFRNLAQLCCIYYLLLLFSELRNVHHGPCTQVASGYEHKNNVRPGQRWILEVAASSYTLCVRASRPAGMGEEFRSLNVLNVMMHSVRAIGA